LEEGGGKLISLSDPSPPPSDVVVEPNEDGSALAKVTTLLAKFARLLEASGRLSPLEAANATELAARGDTVLLAAYSVAASARDADFLATLVQRVVREFTADEKGRREHFEAERLLLAIDSLYVKHQAFEIDDCRFLQSLVLAKDAVLFAALDLFLQDGDAVEFFDTVLKTLQTRKRELDGEDGEEAEEEASEVEEEEIVEEEERELKEAKARVEIVSEISRALRSGAIDVAAARALSISLSSEEPMGIMLRAAFGAFKQNNDRTAFAL
jgi:hypothetical protein